LELRKIALVIHHKRSRQRKRAQRRRTLRLTIMQGTVSASTRSRTQMRRTRFRYTPLMVSVSAFCRLSMAEVDMVTDLQVGSFSSEGCKVRHVA